MCFCHTTTVAPRGLMATSGKFARLPVDTWGTAQLGHTAPASPGMQRFMQNALASMTTPASPVGSWTCRTTPNTGVLGSSS